ncbi:MAG TPA: SH3 domain-containing protein [Nitrosomonas sp.]|jgi:SH3-like domain-containing protein|nr:SH3 domain-containing protein [Nitrosomonas sp.]MBP9871966.1 SH3 domain-containing protein [Nitrosomonas sp.]HQV88454.1 SH3 domain-containing protein [Nitrosomonas sp.]HRB97396.1 SH3 domain-containing protein [Nitrosomonas sp.]
MRRSSLIKSFCVSSRVNFFLASILLSISSYAVAEMEYFSIAENAAVMYDAPSLKADKLYVASLYLPVEAVVNVDGWVKVRDSSGSLAWVEKRMLSQQRYVVVIVPLADVYQSADTNSELIFQAEENIVLELLDSEHRGWVKVRHLSGQVGYVKINQVWGS